MHMRKVSRHVLWNLWLGALTRKFGWIPIRQPIHMRENILGASKVCHGSDLSGACTVSSERFLQVKTRTYELSGSRLWERPDKPDRRLKKPKPWFPEYPAFCKSLSRWWLTTIGAALRRWIYHNFDRKLPSSLSSSKQCKYGKPQRRK